VGEADEALALARAVRAGGAWVPAIRPPSVAEGTARLRATVMATHTDEHIARSIEAFATARASIVSG
jgi:8-amino-7-oxononanoate synthase